MHIYVTPCCKEKDLSPGSIPAIQRYLSPRIAWVYAQSQQHHLPMRILSGRFGLLAPEECIPYYDHPLSLAEVPSLLPTIIKRLEQETVTRVTFYARPRQTPGWEPYYQVLELACRNLIINFQRVQMQNDHF